MRKLRIAIILTIALSVAGAASAAPSFSPVTTLNQGESGYTVTPFGASLGLTNSDINGNASHNIFLGTPLGLSVVDIDAQGNTMSLAGRPEFIPAPEPGTLILFAAALAGLYGTRKRS